MSDLKLKDLRYLVALADTRHFGRAAQRCFVSQPTLSAQLKKLEDYLGVQLIERQPKRVALTEAGEQIVARARRILEASDEVVALARARIAIRWPGKLRLALLPTIGPYLLPLVAREIRKRCRAWSCCCTSTRPSRCWRSCSAGRDRRRHSGAAGGPGRAGSAPALRRALRRRGARAAPARERRRI